MAERHRCDETCVCPVHGTALIYWPAGDDHACQDPTCVHARGMRGRRATLLDCADRLRVDGRVHECVRPANHSGPHADRQDSTWLDSDHG